MMLNDVFAFNCAHPRLIRRSDLPDAYQYVSCGKCDVCVSRLKSMWTLRIRNEASMSEYNLFSTLTYDDAHVPFDIAYEDFQAFCKRLRKKMGFRYYVASEYGSPSRTFRPHFHVIMFGLKANAYTVQAVQDAWGNGFTKSNSLTAGRAKYACGYVEKKWCDDSDDVHEILPFCRSSLKPGIGASWLFTHEDRVKRDFQVSFGGDVYPIPRYYVGLIDDEAWQSAYRNELKRLAHDRKLEFFEQIKGRVESIIGFVPEDWDLILNPENEWLLVNRHRCATLARARELFKKEVL